MPLSTIARHDDLLSDLVHDLRQPLGNIETSVYLLNLMTPDNARVHAQLEAIDGQLRKAARLLTEASAELRRMRTQRLEAAEIMDLTNPVTAGVA